jgi:hypothetical protein
MSKKRIDPETLADLNHALKELTLRLSWEWDQETYDDAFEQCPFITLEELLDDLRGEDPYCAAPSGGLLHRLRPHLDGRLAPSSALFEPLAKMCFLVSSLCHPPCVLRLSQDLRALRKEGGAPPPPTGLLPPYVPMLSVQTAYGPSYQSNGHEHTSKVLARDLFQGLSWDVDALEERAIEIVRQDSDPDPLWAGAVNYLAYSFMEERFQTEDKGGGEGSSKKKAKAQRSGRAQ